MIQRAGTLTRRWILRFRLWFYQVTFPTRRRWWHMMYYVGMYLQTAAINFMIAHNVPMPPDELMAEDRYYRPYQDRYWRDYE